MYRKGAPIVCAVGTKKASPLAGLGNFYEKRLFISFPEGHLQHNAQWSFSSSLTYLLQSLLSASSSSCATFTWLSAYLSGSRLLLNSETSHLLKVSSQASLLLIGECYLFSSLLALFILSFLMYFDLRILLYIIYYSFFILYTFYKERNH